MVKYEATIQSNHPISEVFEYLADFASAQEWDPAVTEANRVNPGQPELGSQYALVSRFLWTQVPLLYEIVAIDCPNKVVLRAERGSFCSEDTITFKESPSGTTVSYTANLTFAGLSKALSPLMQLIFNGMGRRAVQGLAEALNAPVIRQTQR